MFLYYRAKKNVAEGKREAFKTGDGVPPAEVPPDSEKVITLLGDNINDIGNPFDCDAMPPQGKCTV